MKKVFLTALVATGLGVVASSAAVTMFFDGGRFRDNLGSPLANGSMFLIMVDTNNDGFAALNTNTFAGINPTAGSTIGGDYVLVSTFTKTVGGLSGSINEQVINFDLNTGPALNVNTGDRLAFVWFTQNVGTVSTGTKYGVFTTLVTDAVSGGNSVGGMVIQPDSTTTNINYYDNATASGALATAANFTANLTVIPEPATAMLGLVGGLLLLRRRRA